MEKTKTFTSLAAPKRVALARILVATDFSPVSERALDYAISIARRFDARIILAHVITLDAYPMVAPELAGAAEAKARHTAELQFHKIEQSGRLKGVAHQKVIEEGSLWATIESLIEKLDIDLVVVGTHGAGGLKKILLGSGAEEIFRHASVPVLTVGPHVRGITPNEREFKNILFATDFGPGAEKEAAFAASLAQEHQARLTMLDVIPYLEEYSEEAVRVAREGVVRQLRELLPRDSEFWCKPEFNMVIGDPVEEILRFAKESNADLIVMGAKKRDSLAAYLPHTKAYRVVTAASCPVLTVRS